MPLNQFNFKPTGNTYNESSSFEGNGNNKYYDYYMSPTYKKLAGGIGAGNSSHGLRATANNNGLTGLGDNYTRALGELASTLAFKEDGTSISKYVAPSRSSYSGSYYSPSYISLNNVDKGDLYRLGDSNEEIAKAQAIMKANGMYSGPVTGVYDTATRDATINWKTSNSQSNKYGTTFGNETINKLNSAGKKVTESQYKQWLNEGKKK